MKLDARKPLLVLTGAWNPAIFTPGWVALHICGYPEGTNVSFRIIGSVPDGKQIVYIDERGVGYCADSSRLEIYLNKISKPTLEHAADFVSRVSTVLPHTPAGDFGVNFQFVQEQILEEISDKLSVNDNIDHFFRVVATEVVSRIAHRTSQLNFKRQLSDAGVIFDFNYHHSSTRITELERLSADYMFELFMESCETLRKLYDITLDGQLAHEFNNPRSTH